MPAEWFHDHSGFAAAASRIPAVAPDEPDFDDWGPVRVPVFNNYGFLLMFIMQKFIEFLLAYFVSYSLGA